MHIKQITISNFRSFRKQPEVEPFSETTNAIVGRNGSGKSNLFDAIQFVLLAPKFWTLRTEDRQALLHEGSGQAAVNAYVEIIFSNTDGRFQGDSASTSNNDEIILRRTVGKKKDEIFLQRKKTTKNEVMSLLEGAGFSKSNPYFIVQQGKVNALCVMTDEMRLELLKEVAGTTVYDEKKKESKLKMEENSENMEKIQETLNYMNERLDELRSEKEELTIYTKLDKQRKAMAYTLYDKELRRARETLDEMEHEKMEESDIRNDIYEKLRVTADEISNVEVVLKSKSNGRKRNKVLTKDLEEDKTAAVTLRTKLDLQTKELSETIQSYEKTLTQNKETLKELTQQISKEQHTLGTLVQPKYDDAKEALNRMTHERNDALKKMEGLYAKQGRGSQFKSKTDRDRYLSNQIQDLNQVKDDKVSILKDSQDTLGNVRRSITSMENDITNETNQLSKKEKTLDSLQQTLLEKKRERNEMAEQRKVNWSELSTLSANVSEARENERRAHSTLRKVMPRNTAMGLNALSRIVQEERIVVGEQYFGPVMDNIELTDEKFQTAVEAAAQNALFHVIVDTDATAARLMKRLERERLGRVTFLPLNQLNVSNATYPDSNEVYPLINVCIRFDSKLKKAFQHIFGKKLLASSVEVASTWSTKCQMDAVTLEGDLCSRKGSLSGGYVDSSKSRLKALYGLKEAEKDLIKLQGEEKNMREKNNQIDVQITALMSETQRLEAQKANLEHTLSNLDDDVTSLQNRLESSNKQVKKIEAETIPPIQVEIKSLEGQIQLLQEEMGTELSETLTLTEKDLLQQLKSIQNELDSEIETQTQVFEEVGVERQRLLSLLEDNLLKKKRELEEEGAESSSSRRKSTGGQSASYVAQNERKENLEQLERELDEAIRNADHVKERLEEAKKVDEELYKELMDAKKKLDELKVKDARNTNDLKKAEEREAKLMNKRSLCVTRRELHARRIQELGSLPPTSELAKYRPLSISALMEELNSVNTKLKEYSHVNKKAYDQFVNFSEQRESLLKRKDEVDKGAEKVKELIESLDRQKDEAINRTFRGVSAHFKDVFKELVPNGAGELIMRTTLDDEDDGEIDSDDVDLSIRRQNPSVSRYRGVGIKVRFSAVGENYLMSQLSGGQKSLVALALIFAIQRCDPAPFYLFDELDQALDSTYRKAVAGLIQRQANSQENPTQFICSTFRPEIVSIAHRCYGISHQNKVSQINDLTKNDALHFIANLMNEEEAVGEVSSFATSNASRVKKRKMIRVDEEPHGEEDVVGED